MSKAAREIRKLNLLEIFILSFPLIKI